MFILHPGKLSLHDIIELVYKNPQQQIKLNNYKAVEKSAQIVQDIIKSNKTVYGINTGFGLLANTNINTGDLEELQRRILLSHACGIGEPIDDTAVRMILLLKINSLARGYSGIRPIVLDYLIYLFNHQIYPVIPRKGSVGASGDLAPLAHMCLPIIGEGYLRINGKQISAKEYLQQSNLTPINLIAKEGLALINGTQASCALGLIGLIEGIKNFSLACISGALSLEGIHGKLSPFDARVNALKNNPDQDYYASIMRDLVAGSQILATPNNKVQDPYSTRGQPQVMGATLTILNNATTQLINEANSVSDNPLVFADDNEILSGGNFHAQIVAITADTLAIAICEIGSISERRTAILTDKNMTGLPAFLVNNPGLNSGFMMAHVTTAALVSENKTHAHPR